MFFKKGYSKIISWKYIGTKRIGIALSDYLQVIATPHSTIPREPEKKALELIQINSGYFKLLGNYKKVC